MAKHFMQLRRAAVIKTPSFALAERALDDVVEREGMGVIYGEAGLGKTFAVAEWLEHRCQRPATQLELPSDPTPRYVATALVRALTGVSVSETLWQLTDRLLEILETPQVIVLDEAQRLRYRAVEFLRHLYDSADTHLALVLVGGNGCWEVISRHPMLLSRVWRPVQFERLTPERVLRIIPRYHRIYRDAAPRLLREIDDDFAQGNFRNWAGFTATAAGLCEEHGLETIDEAVVASAFALHGGGVRAA